MTNEHEPSCGACSDGSCQRCRGVAMVLWEGGPRLKRLRTRRRGVSRFLVDMLEGLLHAALAEYEAEYERDEGVN